MSSLIHDSNNKDVAKRKLYTFVKYFCEYSGQTCRRKSIGRVLNEEDPKASCAIESVICAACRVINQLSLMLHWQQCKS